VETPSAATLKAIIDRAVKTMRDLVRTTVPEASIFYRGAIEISPVNLAVWTRVDTDAQRDRLAADTSLREAMRQALATEGYPAWAISDVVFAFESEETVKRVYANNWWFAVRSMPMETLPPARLKAIIDSAVETMGDLVRATVPEASLFYFGAIEIRPNNLAVWTRVDTDAQRDRLAADTSLRLAMRQALAAEGYPAWALSGVAFAFQSDETVKRDYEGNWWYAIK
jgi:hypothetical protein